MNPSGWSATRLFDGQRSQEDVSLPAARYKGTSSIANFFSSFVDGVRNIPGIQAAGLYFRECRAMARVATTISLSSSIRRPQDKQTLPITAGATVNTSPRLEFLSCRAEVSAAISGPAIRPRYHLRIVCSPVLQGRKSDREAYDHFQPDRV